MTHPEINTDLLRRRALQRRRAMDALHRADASRQICKQFLASRYFLGSRVIACYLSTWDEVDTGEIIERAWRAKKRIFVPVIRKHGEMSFCEIRPATILTRNSFGLWEPSLSTPMDPVRFDTVVTPLVAFDESRNRIGMGSGYFDRAFAFLRGRHCWLQPKLIGLAFDCQKVKKIVPNPWDIPLYRIFHETP